MINHLLRLARGRNICGEILKHKVLKPKRVVVDFSSPNIAKKFHVGNLRSTLIGNFYCNINRLAGNEVIAVNYLGDWGNQFALLLAHWPNSKYKRVYEETMDALSNSDCISLYMKAYVEAAALRQSDISLVEKRNQIHKEMEEALISGIDDKLINEWREFRQMSIEYLKALYNEFGTNFQEWDAESRHVIEGKRITDEWIQSGLAHKDVQGAFNIPYPGNHAHVVVQKSDRTTLYITREIAAILDRDRKYSADEYVYVVDQEQGRHFAALKYLLQLKNRDDLAQKIHHLSFGRVIGLSTRKGKMESVDEIMTDGMKAARKYIEKSPTIRIDPTMVEGTAKDLVQGAIVVNELKRSRRSNYYFSLSESFSQSKATFMLQEKYSRICSLLEKNNDLVEELQSLILNNDQQLTIEGDKHSRSLFQCLYELDSALFASYSGADSSPIGSYLHRLCGCIGSSISNLSIKNAESKEVALNRLLLLIAAKNVLEEGMHLIGLKPLEKI